MEKILFDKNHVKVTVGDKFSSSSKYRIGWATNHTTMYPEGMTITEVKEKYEHIIKESPLGFYYEAYEKVPYEVKTKVGIQAIFHNVWITLANETYRIEYPAVCGDVKIGFDARPWDICVGDKTMPEHFIKALKKILDEIFVWAAPIKHMKRTKEKIYTELFGNIKGDINPLPNEIKILSHGFDPKESFRKRKKEKTWKKKKKTTVA
jgi:hypothetical protein